MSDASDVRKAIASVELRPGLGLRQGEVLLGHGVDLGDAGRRIMAFYLHDFEATRAFQTGGYASIVQYGEQRWDLDRRRTRELVRIGGRLRELGRIDEAFCAREIGWSKVVELCKVAVPEYEEQWLELARKLDCTALKIEVKLASASGRPRDPGDRKGLPEVRFDVSCRVSALVREKLDLARDKLCAERGELFGDAELLEVMADLLLESDEDGTVSGRMRVPSSQFVVVLRPDPAGRGMVLDGEQGKVPLNDVECGCAICDGQVLAVRGDEGARGGPREHGPERGSGPTASHETALHETALPGAALPETALPGTAVSGATTNGTATNAVMTHAAAASDASRYLSPEEAAILDRATPPWLRKRVLLRDGWRCRCCGIQRQVQAHHILWRARGGQTRADNMLALCHSCHSLVHAELLILRGKHEGEITFLDREGRELRRGAGRSDQARLVELKRAFAHRYGAEAGFGLEEDRVSRGRPTAPMGSAGSMDRTGPAGPADLAGPAGCAGPVDAAGRVGSVDRTGCAGRGGHPADADRSRPSGPAGAARPVARPVASSGDASSPVRGRSGSEPRECLVRWSDVPTEVDAQWWATHESLMHIRKGGGLDFREGFVVLPGLCPDLAPDLDPAVSPSSDPSADPSADPSVDSSEGSSADPKEGSGADSSEHSTEDYSAHPDICSEVDCTLIGSPESESEEQEQEQPQEQDRAAGMEHPVSAMQDEDVRVGEGMQAREESPAWEDAGAAFLGLEDVVRRLRREALGSRERGKGFPHVLFTGPEGTGKTSLAVMVAQALGRQIHRAMGPMLQDVPALLRLVTGMREGECLFLDEIHAIPVPVLETLYEVMEGGVLRLNLYCGNRSRCVELRLPRLTVLAATTEPAQLPRCLLSRFGVVESLTYYADAELAKILVARAADEGVELVRKAAMRLAICARGTPRGALRLMDSVFNQLAARKTESARLKQLALRASARAQEPSQTQRSALSSESSTGQEASGVQGASALQGASDVRGASEGQDPSEGRGLSDGRRTSRRPEASRRHGSRQGASVLPVLQRVTLRQVASVLEQLGFSEEGLSELDQRYLARLRAERRPMSLRRLALDLGCAPELLATVVEPHLTRMGWVEMTPQGRAAVRCVEPATSGRVGPRRGARLPRLLESSKVRGGADSGDRRAWDGFLGEEVCREEHRALEEDSVLEEDSALDAERVREVDGKWGEWAGDAVWRRAPNCGRAGRAVVSGLPGLALPG